MKISVRQICFILLAYTAATKLLMYPTILSSGCGRDLLFPALIDFAVEAVVIWAISFLCSRTDKTFYELLSGTVGKVGAKIVYGLFAAFFLLATIVPMFEQEQYVHNIFYDTVPSLTVFLPFFIFSLYACTKKFENIGRCADICLPVFLFAFVAIFVMSVNEVEWMNLMPVLKSPAKSVFGSAAGSLLYFAEPAWLLMMMGRFDYKKGDAAKITLSYLGGATLVILFLAMFYGIYGPITSSRTFAVSRTSLFFSAIETMGRIDLIMLYVMETVMLFALVLNIQLAVHAISLCTGYKNVKVISLLVNAALLTVLVLFDTKYNAINVLYHKWMWIAFIVFTVVMPLLAWTLRRRERE